MELGETRWVVGVVVARFVGRELQILRVMNWGRLKFHLHVMYTGNSETSRDTFIGMFSIFLFLLLYFIPNYRCIIITLSIPNYKSLKKKLSQIINRFTLPMKHQCYLSYYTLNYLLVSFLSILWFIFVKQLLISLFYIKLIKFFNTCEMFKISSNLGWMEY